MSGVLCTWAANIPKASEQWYEDEYIPSMAPKLAQHALHCKLVGTGLDDGVDGVGNHEAPWKFVTVYEIEDIDKATDATYDQKNHPSMTEGLENARFDVRTYEEVKRWQTEDWDGNHADVVSVAIMEWEIEPGAEKPVLDFYHSEAAPTIASSPDVLRFRMLKIKNATVLKADSYKTLEKKSLHTYLSLVELESEEWPWDMVVKLGENPKWRGYFEGQTVVKWQSSHYLVEKKYPGDDE